MGQTDLVFLCTPIGGLSQSLADIKPYLSPHTIVTDVGSVKGWVVEQLSSLWPNFIGGHPMAGTAETGIMAAQEKLFKDRPYVLTPRASTQPKHLAILKGIIEQLAARLFFADPQDHDRAVAWISHLPIFVSAGLMGSCLREQDDLVLNLAKALASTGFKDTSRVGGGNPELGRMVAEYNQTELLSTLDSFEQVLGELRQWIQGKEWSKVEGFLQVNQTARPDFL